MEWMGLGLLVMVAMGIVFTGLPALLVLLTVSVCGAAIGVASGTIPFALLSALPGRLINLFENDLLQALPLYVLMGVLLDRMPIADALYRAGLAILPRGPAAAPVSGMMLGALIGPMSGSVGASVLAMTRIVAPRLSASGIPAPTRFAVVAVASTLGVVIPPSLVLILLGDAMLSAHTMAVTASGRADRVINTQDVFHGALVPAAIMLVFCLLVAWRAGRNIQIESSSQQKTTLTGAQAILAGISVLSLVTLLGGIAAGQFYAVEAAAMGATVLLVTGIVFGHLRLKALDEILRDTMAVTGALFALLLAATTLTLVLRTFGTDRLIGNWITSIPGNDIVVMTVVLAAIGICAFVLDAFEIIFVVIPIVVPPLLVRVADARWVAVLILLTLQISFLLPPLGYALMMVRGNFKENISFSALARAFSPFLLAQWVVLAIVLCAPQLVHIGEKAADTSRTPLVPLSDQEINRRFEQMMPKLPEPD